MIGVIAAKGVEMEGLRPFIQDPVSQTIAGMTFISGTLEGKEIVTAICGSGKVCAAACAQAMISTFNPEAIINIGVAGSLSSELSIGALAISTSVVQHDVDATTLGYPMGYITELKRSEIAADRSIIERLSACAKALGYKTVNGVIASGDQFISSEEKKQFIVDNFGAIACEMEGGAIGQVCYINHVPFCVIRAISDSADGTSKMDYNAFLSMAAERSVKLIYAFMRS